jgi:hypothetical protein
VIFCAALCAAQAKAMKTAAPGLQARGRVGNIRIRLK